MYPNVHRTIYNPQYIEARYDMCLLTGEWVKKMWYTHTHRHTHTHTIE